MISYETKVRIKSCSHTCGLASPDSPAHPKDRLEDGLPSYLTAHLIVLGQLPLQVWPALINTACAQLIKVDERVR